MLFQSINVVSHEESNGPAQFCFSQTIGRQPSLCPHTRDTKNHYYLDGESSHNHREEVGFICLEEVKPQSRHNSSPMFEALLCKTKARFLPQSPRSKEPSTRGEIRREGILALYKREILTLELIWKWNGPILGAFKLPARDSRI